MPRRRRNTSRRPLFVEETSGDAASAPVDAAEESFAELCKALRVEFRLNQGELGERLGVSQRTVARYEDGVIPLPLQAPGVAMVIESFAPHYAARVRAALALPAPARVEDAPTVAAPPQAISAPLANGAILKAALEGALFEAGERIGAPSARVREAALIVLERAALLGLGTTEAAAILRG
jgi:DNA-binding transcriptional regulator YiaG